MSSRSEGLTEKYVAERSDTKPLKGGRCVVLEVGDVHARPAHLVWADSLEARDFEAVARDVRSLVAEHAHD